MVPFAKDRLALNDSSLGLLMLSLGAGAICTMPFAGWLIGRIGSRLVMIVSAFVIAFSLPTLLLLDSWLTMAAALFIFGAGVGSIDVAMNTHGSAIQNHTGKPIMSSLHGLFSVGGLIGPLFIGLLIKMGVNPIAGAAVMSLCLLVLTFSKHSSLLRHQQETALAEPTGSAEGVKPKQSAWLHGGVLFLGLMCFIAFLSEGAMLDWGALLLHDYKGVDKALSGLGYAFFSVAMAVMRLSGDRIVSKFSSKTVVVAGSVIAFIGYSCILFITWVPATLLGFVLIGIGASNIVPVFFSAAGSMKGVVASSAVSIIGTIGYAGQLAGPAILGVLAQRFSLPAALFITGVLLLIAGPSFLVSELAKQRNKPLVTE
jgi:predicted MFS family arabinose efflux permease